MQAPPIDLKERSYIISLLVKWPEKLKHPKTFSVFADSTEKTLQAGEIILALRYARNEEI